MLRWKLSGGIAAPASVGDFDSEKRTNKKGEQTGTLSVNYSEGDLLAFTVLTADSSPNSVKGLSANGNACYFITRLTGGDRTSQIWYSPATSSGSSVSYTLTLSGGEDTEINYILGVHVVSALSGFAPVVGDFGTASGTNAVNLSLPFGAAVIACANTNTDDWPGSWTGVDQDLAEIIDSSFFLNEYATIASRGDIGASSSYDISVSDSIGETVAAAFESSVPPAFSVEFVDSAYAENTGTSELFLDLSVGDPAVTRRIYAVVALAAVNSENSFSIDSVTIGGASATEVVTARSDDPALSIYEVSLPTGTLADVAVTLSGDIDNERIDVAVALYRATNSRIVATASDLVSPIDYSISGVDSGRVIAGLVCSQSATFSVSGVTVDDSRSGPNLFYWAGSETTTGSSTTITSNSAGTVGSAAITLQQEQV